MSNLILREDPFPVDLLGATFQSSALGCGHPAAQSSSVVFQPWSHLPDRPSTKWEACASPLTLLTTFNWLHLLPQVLWRACTSLARCLCNRSSKQHQTILCHQWRTGHSAKVRGILGHKANSWREELEVELVSGTINVLSCISQNERCLPNEPEHNCWVLEWSSLWSIPEQTPISMQLGL